MGHVFRLSNDVEGGNTTTIIDWNSSSVTTYNHTFVNAIAETTTTQREITSIPSPFARIELVKEAFGKVAPVTTAGMTVDEVKKSLHGNTIYHKMVSDSLDVAQLFFSYPSMKDKLEIIVWQRDQNIKDLLNSNSPAHQTVGKTLDMFLKQDALGNDPYNFGKLQNIYILKYKGPGQRQMHIIGATSPSTLFFSTANDESKISQELCFGTDYAFDGSYSSLDERDAVFVKYLYAFRYSNPFFNAHYPEVSRYLDAVYYVLENDMKNEINEIQNACQTNNHGNRSYVDSNYDALDVQVNTSTIFRVEINGVPYYCNKPVVAGNSDFEISSTKNINGQKPLVLPVVFKTEYNSLIYLGCNFGPNFNVPYYDQSPLGDRRLPGIGVQHPYLTISDFLEDKIVKLPSPVNSKDYFDGNYTSNNNKKEGYLIPVTDRFFDYFTVSDLKGTNLSGKKMIEITTLASGVEVTLRIPIQNGKEIVYKRIYNLDVKADNVNNQGAIVLPPSSLGIGVFPPVKFAQEKDSHFRIVLASEFEQNMLFSCTCYDKNGRYEPKYVVRNTDVIGDIRTKVYFADNRSLDFARIGIHTDRGREREGNGLLIPNFPQKTGSGAYVFAIDLGTSNTHIEYKDINKNERPMPFEFNSDEPQISLLFTPNDDIVSTHIRGEFIPESIGHNSLCSFPMRTVLSVDRNNAGINETGNGQYVALGNASPAFLYNKEIVGPKYNEYVPNLKWRSNDKGNEVKLNCYIESLLLMIRTKVLQMGGSLRLTQIKWFYPISMSNIKFGMFQRIWNTTYRKYFDSESDPVAITESVAPYQFFQKMRQDVSDIVTIDIGGGTTDIVVADLNGVKCITSMRFAADAIFGNPLVEVQNGRLNGIVRQFKDEFLSQLEGDGPISDLRKMLNELTENGFGNSSEAASFMFSLADNKYIKENNLSQTVNFNDALMKDLKQKVVFYVFYTSIIYHLAKLMNKLQLKAPSNIAFSGNGSKVVPLLTPNVGSLEKLTTLIFKLVYSNYDVDKNIKLILNSENPKEATCKGGIFLQREPDNIQSMKKILLADELLNDVKYKDADGYIDNVIDEVRAFTDFIFLKVPKAGVSLKSEFGIDQKYVDLAIDCFNENLRTYLERGVQMKLNSGDVDREDQIEETMFFYPIVGVMNDLSNRVCDF